MQKSSTLALMFVLPALVACDAGNYILEEIAGRSFVCDPQRPDSIVGFQTFYGKAKWGKANCKELEKTGVKQRYECFSKVDNKFKKGPEEWILHETLEFDTVTRLLINTWKFQIPDGVAGEDYYNCNKVSR